ADQAKLLQAVADFPRGLDHHLERYVGRRIEVEDQAARLLGLKGLAVPRVKLKSAGLGGGDQSLDTIELDIGLAIPPDLDLGDQRRLALGRVSLEEFLRAVDSIGHSDHRTGP